VQAEVWDFIKRTKTPVLGICYGLQEISHALGGRVEKAAKREFGHANVRKEAPVAGLPDIMAGLPESFSVWMSHGDKITVLPAGFRTVAVSDNSEFAAVAGLVEGVQMYGLQFHPEVTHTAPGKAMLANFVLAVCGARQDWSMASFVPEAIDAIRRLVGDKHVIGAVSGGVDSTVAAVLLSRCVAMM